MKIDDKKSAEISIIEAIKSEQLADIATDYSEILLDSFLEEGLLKEIPAIGTIVKSYAAFSHIRDRFFMRKIASFLFELKDIPTTDRIKLIEELETDSNRRGQVGLSILMLLDRADDMNKPQMIAKLFKAKLTNSINTDELFRFAYIIEKTYIGNIRILKKLQTKEYISKQEITQLKNSGLCELQPKISNQRNPRRGTNMSDSYQEQTTSAVLMQELHFYEDSIAISKIIFS